MHAGELPELATLMALDRSNCPRCLLWHGWLPELSCAGESDPWATSFGDLACCKLECRLDAYLSDTSASGTPPDYWDADDIALAMSDTAASGLGVFFGMGGCLVLVALVIMTLGLPLLVI